jgi:hypothetical protein
MINLAWVEDQPSFGLLLALAVKYQVTKALPLSLQQLILGNVAKWMHFVPTASKISGCGNMTIFLIRFMTQLSV